MSKSEALNVASIPHEAAGFPVGKALISAAAVLIAGGAFLADWNKTHMFNPKWTPHTKFHGAQTVILAVETAGLSLWQLWGPGKKTGREGVSRLRWATLFGSLFWLTLPPAILFPDTELADADNPTQPTSFAGIPVNQVTGLAAIILPVLASGYALEMRRLKPIVA